MTERKLTLLKKKSKADLEIIQSLHFPLPAPAHLPHTSFSMDAISFWACSQSTDVLGYLVPRLKAPAAHLTALHLQTQRPSYTQDLFTLLFTLSLRMQRSISTQNKSRTLVYRPTPNFRLPCLPRHATRCSQPSLYTI